MKYVTLVRHAEAVKAVKCADNYSRYLSPKGRSAAEKLAESLFREKDGAFDIIISSPALRAYETAVVLADRSGFARDRIAAEDSLFRGDESALADTISMLNDRYSSALIIGHSPAVDRAAWLLTGGLTVEFSKCAALRLSFDTDKWKSIRPGSGSFIFYKFINDGEISSFEKKVLRISGEKLSNAVFSGVSGIEPAFMESRESLLRECGNFSAILQEKTDTATVRTREIFDAAQKMIEDKINRKNKKERERIDRKLRRIDREMARTMDRLSERKNRILRIAEMPAAEAAGEQA
jgi:phosphohistidine phosphatase